VPQVSLNKAAWKASAIGALVLGLALVAGLLAQGGLFSEDPGSPGHPDGLTTLALVLAILAFLVQIFVFVFQTNANRDSERRSEELNAETQVALSKIEANSAATQKVLFAQFDRLLDYVVDSPGGPTTGSGPKTPALDPEDSAGSSEEARPATVADVQRIVGDAVPHRDRPSFGLVPSEEDRQVVGYLREWPSKEETELAVTELSKFPPLALAMLTRYGTTEVRQRLEGRQVGLLNPNVRPEVTRWLIDEGFLKEEGELVRLTEAGRELARVMPIGKPGSGLPPWWDEVVRPLMAKA